MRLYGARKRNASMSMSIIKAEFYQWVRTLANGKLNEIDKKLLNLLVDHFDTIAPLGTAKGARALKIGEIIQKKHEVLPTNFPDLQLHQLATKAKSQRIAELKIGPFRGFETNELFPFSSKYTFLYGPNGSGKSSFCDGLEYALLGIIEEAESKRIPRNDYIKNMQKGYSVLPKVYTINSEKQKIELQQDSQHYRFAFIEKNRIDGFARIAATTEAIQKDRIATLFGLDAFSSFVDGFTESLDDRYITLQNAKETIFATEKQNNDLSLGRINAIEIELLDTDTAAKTLILEVPHAGLVSLEDLKNYLVGEDSISGIINVLQSKRTELIAEDLKPDSTNSLPTIISNIKESLAELNVKLASLNKLSTQINFQDLYNAVNSIKNDPNTDKTICPACKTPLSSTTVDPFEHAATELLKLQHIVELQNEIEELSLTLSQDIETGNADISQINNIAKISSYDCPIICELTEFSYTNISGIGSWKPKIEQELAETDKAIINLESIKSAVLEYNASLDIKRKAKGMVDEELIKYQGFKTRYDEIIAKRKTLNDEKLKLQAITSAFQKANEPKVKEIEDVNKKIAINRLYVDSYHKLVGNLKLYRDNLPSALSAGLSAKAREYFNIINSHDPDFELFEALTLPVAPTQKIMLCFTGEKRDYDALHILSEGHIRVLGLSILLAKATKEDLGFLIFDDIVNAIDDDHRDGIAELLMNHIDFKERQHIVTCHGELFINKLEHKLGASRSGKEVQRYRFFPQDTIAARGIKVSIGDPKHYLLIAEEALKKDARKEVASHCRQAIESISEQLWYKLGKKLNINLTVKIRSPGLRPDLSSVVDGLIKEIKSIGGADMLHSCLSELKEKYNWCLLNKGIHEQGDLPEFERKEIADLVDLVKKIEIQTETIKIDISTAV